MPRSLLNLCKIDCLLPECKEGFLGYFLSIGLTINSLLGAFNMIPVMPFDGAKILAWNKSVYAITAIIAVGLYFASFGL